MSETSLEFWQRQTLREKQADILKDWEHDRESARKELQSLKDQLEKAEKVIEFYGERSNWNRLSESPNWTKIKNDSSEERLIICDDDYPVMCGGKKARQYFQEKQDQLKVKND